MTPEEIAQNPPPSPLKRQLLLVLIVGVMAVTLTPVIAYLIDKAHWRAEQEIRDERSRHTYLFEARKAFLEKFSSAVWEFQLAMIAIPLNAQLDASDYKRSCQIYDSISMRIIGQLRASSEGAVWFTKPDLQKKIDSHIEWLLAKDLELLMFREQDKQSSEWRQFHADLFAETRSRTKSLILSMATDFEIAAPELVHKETKK